MFLIKRYGKNISKNSFNEKIILIIFFQIPFLPEAIKEQPNKIFLSTITRNRYIMTPRK